VNSLKQFFIPFLFLSLLLISCGKEKVIFEKKYNLEKGQWMYSDTLNFQFDIKDTMEIYDIVLSVKHTPQYPLQNLYTNIYTKFPSGERIKQLLNIDLADNTGKWNGECSSSECNFEIPIQPSAFFNGIGTHTIMLEQFTRNEPLLGINSIELKLVDKGIKRDLASEKEHPVKKKK
jgi:gliding motility-associated lipoprotein GldH